MTRMQKWQSYREEIAKQAAIGRSIATDDEDIKKLKIEIDKINPSILTSINDVTPSLQSGVSNVELQEKEISTEIANMFATINIAANTINEDKVKSIFDTMQNDQIVDKNNKFKEDKLLENPDYSWFKVEKTSLEAHEKEADFEIKNELEKKYNNFTSDKKEHKVTPVITISKDSTKQASHYVFVISVSVSILLLLIILSLFITRMVLW